MSRRSAILIVVSGLVASLVVLGGILSLPGEQAEVSTPGTYVEIEQWSFLNDLDLDEPNADYALVFYDQATGNGTRAVLDENVMRAAQSKAFVADTSPAAVLSPIEPTPSKTAADMPPDGAFVSIIRNREIQSTYTCQVDFCSAQKSTDSSDQREMAGLLDAGLPIELKTLEFRHHEQARAAHWRLLNQDTTVFVYSPNLPSPDTIVYPNRLILDLPPVLLELDDAKDPLTPFDHTDYMARFSAAFAYAYPDTEAYRLNDVTWVTHVPPDEGWPIISEDGEGPLLDSSGDLLGLHGIMVIEPSVAIDLIPDLANTLTGVDPFAEMPEFVRDPSSITTRLDTLAAETLGRPCTSCFKIDLPTPVTNVIKVTPVAPIPFTVSYFKLVQDESTAQ